MKKILTLVLLVGGMGLSLTSCKYKGQCECDLGPIDASTEEQEFDDKEDYEDARDACEDAGCNWQIL